jgi:hypothetical protein
MVGLKMPEGADFAQITGAPVPTIGYNSYNWWQTSFSDMLGTLVHEYAHLQNSGPAGTDAAIQNALVITQNANDTSNISKKFGKDCFGSVPNPKQ